MNELGWKLKTRAEMAEIRRLDEKRMRKRKAPCPVCGKPLVPDFRPFCSERCKTIDLGRWLGGDYRIPTEEVPEEGELMDLISEQERED
jgi:uncharacterized protein